MTAQARRDQLLGVATTLVAERGFRGVSIDDVARTAGVARSLIYKHFAGLDDLLESAVEREMERALSQAAETALGPLIDGEPRRLILESLRSYLCVIETHPTTWKLVLMPPQGAPEILRKRIDRGRAEALEQLAEAVGPALAPKVDPPDAELTARILTAISDEYARLLLADPARYPVERLVEHAGWVLDQAWLSNPGFR